MMIIAKAFVYLLKAYKSKMANLEAIAGDAAAGAVKKNKAANEVCDQTSHEWLISFRYDDACMLVSTSVGR
jgi:hypothetical protein